MRINTVRIDDSKKRATRVLLGMRRGATTRVTIVMIGRDLAFDGSEDAGDPEPR